MGSLLRIAVKLVKLKFAFLGCWSLFESIRALKCCCCVSTGLVHYVSEHCQNALFSGQHVRDTGNQQLRYTFDVCLDNYFDRDFSAHGFAKYAGQDIPPPPPPPFTLPSSSSSSGVAPVGETMIKNKKQEVQRDVDMMSTTVGGTTVQGSGGRAAMMAWRSSLTGATRRD